MTAEDQDAEVGRLVRKRRELRTHHQALISKLESIGKILSSVGKALYVKRGATQNAPVTLVIERNGSVRVSDEYRQQELITGPFPIAEDIRQLLDELERAELRLSELDKRLKTFGA